MRVDKIYSDRSAQERSIGCVIAACVLASSGTQPRNHSLADHCRFVRAWEKWFHLSGALFRGLRQIGRHFFLLLFLYDDTTTVVAIAVHRRRHADADARRAQPERRKRSSGTAQSDRRATTATATAAAALSRSLGHHSLFLSAEEERGVSRLRISGDRLGEFCVG